MRVSLAEPNRSSKVVPNFLYDEDEDEDEDDDDDDDSDDGIVIVELVVKLFHS